MQASLTTSSDNKMQECSGIKRTLLNLQPAAAVVWLLRKRVHSNEIILLYNYKFASSWNFQFGTSEKRLNVVIIENNGSASKDFQQ